MINLIIAGVILLFGFVVWLLINEVRYGKQWAKETKSRKVNRKLDDI